ncbi:tyrosine-type recombinase/integrase [Saccharopolyspora spinosa]|uniref:tyrosine-type recombinase/integrase n=1 Tax=Saccharopolyspora spinosa TaxID=60894 RepID=UPI00130512B6|nr:site-specific integrase [Saccharopolyspora spinosa]
MPDSPDYPTKATAKAAGDAYELHLRALASGLDAKVAPRRGAVTLDAYAPGAIDRTPDLANSSRNSYRGAVRCAVREHFGDGFPVERLTADAVERYYSTIGHLAAKTRQTRIIALATVARRAVRDGVLAAEHHPAHWGITVRGDQPTRRRLLTDAELTRLAAAMPSHLWAAVIIGHDTGLRVSELAALSVTDIEYSPDGRAYLWITRTTSRDGTELSPHVKNGVIRRVPLSARALSAWNHHVAYFVPEGQQRIFRKGSSGKRRLAPAGTGYLTGAMQQCRDRAQIERMADSGKQPLVGWHDLRRAFATKIYRATRDIRELQKLMGHATVAMTMRYIQDFEHEQEHREAVDAAFGGGLSTPPLYPAGVAGGESPAASAPVSMITERAA